MNDIQASELIQIIVRLTDAMNRLATAIESIDRKQERIAVANEAVMPKTP